MSRRLRILFFGGLVLVTGSACNALLGITDLVDPGAPDAATAADAPTSTDNFVPPSDMDAAVTPDAMPTCGTAGDPDPCVVTVAQAAGDAIYPTWPITSDEQVKGQNVTVLPPVHPTYVAAGAGAVTETHTQLTWKTAYAAGGAGVSFDAGAEACAAFGNGWRIPTRIELATTQFREAILDGDGGANRLICIPPQFDTSQHNTVWTSTAVPVAIGDPVNRVYGGAEAACGFQAADKAANRFVRCVNGATKPATFVVSKSKDTVHAVDTGLVWERTGIIVQTYDQAKKHCDGLGARIPVIQELYGIIDTRTTSLFHEQLFVKPQDGGSPRAIVSQTIHSVNPSIDAGYVAAVATINAPWGDEDQAAADEGQPDILLRCVSTYAGK